jgi:tetratricopeptide (TPR) repeat protein
MKKIKLSTFLYLLLLILSNPTNAQKNNNIKLLLLNGEYKKAITILEEKLKDKDTLNFNEYNSLGIAYQNLMNHTKALQMFYKANKIQPENLRSLLLLANANSALNRNNTAKKYYKKIIELDSSNETAMINLGKVLMELTEYDSAATLFGKLLLTDTTNSYFYSQLGVCELKKGNKNSAKEYLEKSVKLNNNNVKTILRLAKLYYADKQYDKAKEILKQGLRQNLHNKLLNKMIAEVYYKQKEYEDAIVKYLFAITTGDSSSQTYQKLGMSYYYLSFTKNIGNSKMKEMKLREGISAFEKSYAKDNNNALTALYLGLCHKALGEYKIAIKYFEESLTKMFPEYIGEVYKNLAVSNEHVKNYKDAIANYRKAINYLPSDRLLIFYLASVYDRYYKDKSIALDYYKKFLNENDNADVKLIEYSKDRIEKLNKEINFWKRKR